MSTKRPTNSARPKPAVRRQGGKWGGVEDTGEENGPGMRLQRLMADRGVASRRECERLIEEGKVTVNKKRVTKLPVFVNPETDDIRIGGLPLPQPVRPAYVILHKPPRTLAITKDDPAFGETRVTISDLVDHPAKARLFPVGRLEYHASGLVLLTTDGDLAHKLTHPRFGVPRVYEALVKRRLTDSDLGDIERAFRPASPHARGDTPSGAVVALRLIKHDEDRSLIEIILREGPNRQVADVLARLGCPVKKLRRTGIGPIRLKGVAVGGWRELTRTELAALKRAAKGHVGAKAAAAAGARPPARRPRLPGPAGPAGSAGPAGASGPPAARSAPRVPRPPSPGAKAVRKENE